MDIHQLICSSRLVDTINSIGGVVNCRNFSGCQRPIVNLAVLIFGGQTSRN